MTRRPSRPIHLAAVVLAFGVGAGAPSVTSAQVDQPALRARRSVATVVVRDGSGAEVAAGTGFFLDIGKLVVPRGLVASGSRLGLVIGDREYRTTAVLAEDRQAGVVLVAVDLPDGAPPAFVVGDRAAGAPLTARAVDAGGTVTDVALGAAAQVPGLGLVQPLESATAVANGSAVVNPQGELVGAAVVTDTGGGARLAFVVPSARLLSMPRIGPLPVLEWAVHVRSDLSSDDGLATARGAAAALAGRLDEAAAAFDAAVTSNPEDTEAWNALAACRRSGGDQARIDVWRRATAAQPANPRFHHEFALALSDAGRRAQAAAQFSEVARLRPRDPEAHFNLGVAFSQIGMFEDEYKAYQMALAIEPTNVKVLRNLGVCCLTLNRREEAASAFARASRLAPADPEVQTGLGLSYLSLRRFGEAIDALRQALRIAPELAKARFGLGVAYFANGDRAAAQSVCQSLRTLDRTQGEQLCRMVNSK